MTSSDSNRIGPSSKHAKVRQTSVIMVNTVKYSLLTFARACAAKGYCSRSLGTVRVWSGVVQEQHVYGGDLKLYSYYTRCALIRDRRPTAWDGFARPAETEATCMWKVSPQIVVGRFLKVCIMSVE